MSVITSILNAILQAIGWLIPISESGHSAIFHDFSGTADGSVWMVTGVIHIGIALGIVLASFRLFKRLSKEFASSVTDLFRKELKIKSASGARHFLYMIMVSFLPMALWLIPVGRYGFLYSVLRMPGYNNTILDEGIFIAVVGGLLFLSARQLILSRNDKPVSLLYAVTVGCAALVLVPVSGFSLIGGVFSILILLGVSKKLAYRYAIVMSVPVLFVMGVIEIVTAKYTAGAVPIILGAVVSVIAGFIFTRILKFIINKSYIKYISYYDLAVGAIASVIGIVQLIVR